MNTAYVLLRTAYADWEAASALAELRRTFGFSVKTIGLTSETVVSMGGLKVMPDLALSAFVPETASILILPGGESWTNGEVPQVSEVVRAMVTLSRPVAAICAATLALAHGGLLDDRLHTSNGKNFIGKYVSEYRGEEFYRASPAVCESMCYYSKWFGPFCIRSSNIPRIGTWTRTRYPDLREALFALGCLTDRVLRWRPIGPCEPGSEIGAFEHFWRITGEPELSVRSSD